MQLGYCVNINLKKNNDLCFFLQIFTRFEFKGCKTFLKCLGKGKKKLSMLMNAENNSSKFWDESQNNQNQNQNQNTLVIP